MTTEHIPGPSGSQFCWFLVIWKHFILRYGKFFKNKKVNFYHLTIQSFQLYFIWPIPINQVDFSWKDLVHLLLKSPLFGGCVIFQASPIYLVSLFQSLNLIWKSKNLSQMMKNEGSNSTFDIKKYHLKFTLLFWNSKIFFTPSSGGHSFNPSKQIFNFSTDSGNLQTKPLMNVK